MTLLLSDALAHPVFVRAGAELLTGPLPVGRVVRWVHSTEVYEVAPLLRGGELLLTTGLGLATADEASRRRYVRGLADAGLTALALELGWTFATMPADLLSEATLVGLPLVALHSLVPFAEITEALNAFIVDQSIVRLRYADELSRALSDALVSGADLSKLLSRLEELVQARAVLAHVDGRTLAVAAPADGAARDEPTGAKLLAEGGCSAPVLVDGVAWAKLVVGNPGPVLRDLVNAVLDRASPAFALELQRTRGDVAATARATGRLMQSLLSADAPPRVVEALAGTCGLPVSGVCYVGAIVPMGVPQATSLLLQAAHDVGHPHVVVDRDGTAFGVLAAPPPERATAALDYRLAQALVARLPAGRRPLAAVGPVVNTLAEVGTSLRRAEASFDAASVAREPGPVAVAARLTAERLLLGMSSPDLQDLVVEHLGPLVTLSSPRREDLLTTLEVYFESAHSKTTAARRLRLQRQSLYQRLERIGELLHHDIDDPQIAEGIWLALRAWRISRSLGR